MSTLLELALLLAALVTGAVAVVRFLQEAPRLRADLGKLERLKSSSASREEELPASPGRVRRKLLASGLRVETTLFLSVSALVGVLVWIVMSLVLPGIVFPLLIGLLAAYVPWLLISGLANYRAWRIERVLASAVSFLIGTLRAGENPSQALMSAAGASEEPASREFRGVAERLDLGMSLARALRPLNDGYDSPMVRLFVQTLMVKWPSGGDLAGVLEKVARTMRERLRLRWNLRSQLSGARVSIVIVSLVPYLIIPAYLWATPGWVDMVFQDDLGKRLVAGAVLLQVAGYLYLRRLLRIEL